MWCYNASKKTNTDLDIRMNKNYKILFWIGLLLFIVPELLWSPVANVYYTFFQSGSNIVLLRDNFITSAGYNLVYKGLILLEALGLLTSILLVWKYVISGNQKKLGYLILILLFIASALSLLSFYAITFINISFP